MPFSDGPLRPSSRSEALPQRASAEWRELRRRREEHQPAAGGDDRGAGVVGAAGADVHPAHQRLRPIGPAAERRHPPQSKCRGRGACTRRGAQGTWTARTAARDPGAAEGQLRHERHANDRRLARAARHRPETGCVSGREAAAGRRGAAGQGEPPRARARSHDGQLVRWLHVESLRRDARTGRIERRLRRGRGRVLRGVHAGNRHQRIDPDTQLAQLDRGPAADGGALESCRHHSVRSHPGHWRPDGADRRRHRAHP